VPNRRELRGGIVTVPLDAKRFRTMKNDLCDSRGIRRVARRRGASARERFFCNLQKISVSSRTNMQRASRPFRRPRRIPPSRNRSKASRRCRSSSPRFNRRGRAASDAGGGGRFGLKSEGNLRTLVWWTMPRQMGTVGGAAAVASDELSADQAITTAGRFPRPGDPLGERGRYVVFLDDDSYSRARVRWHGLWKTFRCQFRGWERRCLRITLPEGRGNARRIEVFIGCGDGFSPHGAGTSRGAFRRTFHEAEEYDLRLRLLAAGYDIRTLA